MTIRERPTALLVDLDGVLRVWDPEFTAGVEERYGLATGALLTAALATNATDGDHEDLAALGLTDDLDAVVNSAELGVAKPAPEFYAAACAAVGVPPRGCLLVDDTDRNVRGARAAGLAAHRWTGPADLPYLRAALGLWLYSPVTPSIASRIRSAWPLCRAYSSIMWT